MATQTVEFAAPSGLTLTAKVTALLSDTVVATASSVTEATNRKGTYAAAFTDLAAGTYNLTAFKDSVGVARWITTTLAAEGTYPSYESVWLHGGQAGSANGLGDWATDSDVSISLVPAYSQISSRVAGDTLRAFLNEATTFTVAPLDADGNAVNTSGMTLEVVIEDGKRADLETIANASITKTSTTYTFTVSAATNANEMPNGKWSCRRTDTDVVIGVGPYVVDYAP